VGWLRRFEREEGEGVVDGGGVMGGGRAFLGDGVGFG
jgi:hypothetical protein